MVVSIVDFLMGGHELFTYLSFTEENYVIYVQGTT